MNLRFSLVTLFGITGYVAACCPIFVYPSTWWGTLLLAVTIAVFVASSLRSATKFNRFWRGFSIAGWIWLSLSLGFYAESTNNDSIWERSERWLYAGSRAMARCTTLPVGESRQSFSLHPTGPLVVPRDPEGRQIACAPLYENFVRLLACTSSLVFALIGGVLFHALQRMKDQYHPEDRSVA